MKEGYYWVKQNNSDLLRVTYFDGISWWQLCGSVKLYFESDFSYISEKINEPKID